MLVQTEVERVKFIVRSYIRTRLFKVISPFLLLFQILHHALQIEKFARYIMTNPEVQQRLAESEVEHARRYVVSLASLEVARRLFMSPDLPV
jgi:GINS complex subunit 4